ncbi:MAG: hypothetical protein RIR00_1087, partial [Pseudomonadota bacterium]
MFSPFTSASSSPAASHRGPLPLLLLGLGLCVGALAGETAPPPALSQQVQGAARLLFWLAFNLAAATVARATIGVRLGCLLYALCAGIFLFKDTGDWQQGLLGLGLAYLFARIVPSLLSYNSGYQVLGGDPQRGCKRQQHLHHGGYTDCRFDNLDHEDEDDGSGGTSAAWITPGSQRLWRHVLSSSRRRWQDFTPAVLQALAAGLPAAEAEQRGELRLVLEGPLPIDNLWRQQTPRQRAAELFRRLGLWENEDEAGVLVYLQLVDGQIEILADRGMAQRV